MADGSRALTREFAALLALSLVGLASVVAAVLNLL
jgi:hypothetical protein